MATVAEFRAVLPMWAAVDDPTIQTYLDMAARTVTLEDAGDSADDAHIFLAAHLMSLVGIGPSATAGALAGFTNIRAGSLSLTRSEQAAAGEYASSNYGILFWRIWQKGMPGVAMTVTGTGTLPLGSVRYPHGQA